MNQTSDIYKPPASNLDSYRVSGEKIYSTLAPSVRVVLALLLCLDGFYLLISLLASFLGAREYGLLFILLYLLAIPFTFKSVVKRELSLVALIMVLHVLPGFNPIGAVLCGYLVWCTYSERRIHNKAVKVDR